MVFEEIKRLKDRLQDENLALREEIDQAFMFEEIVGASLDTFDERRRTQPREAGRRRFEVPRFLPRTIAPAA
jgi:hypothetical protein